MSVLPVPILMACKAPFSLCMYVLMAVNVFVPMAVRMLMLMRMGGPPMRVLVRMFVSVRVLVFVCMLVVSFHRQFLPVFLYLLSSD